LLGLGTANFDLRIEDDNQTYNALPRGLKEEMARRCSWAIWFTQCIGSDNPLSELNLTPELQNSPLPMSEISYAQYPSGMPEEHMTISQLLESETREQSTDCVFAELMVAIYFWSASSTILTKQSLTTF
jgi:hypothetical protein